MVVERELVGRKAVLVCGLVDQLEVDQLEVDQGNSVVASSCWAIRMG